MGEAGRRWQGYYDVLFNVYEKIEFARLCLRIEYQVTVLMYIVLSVLMNDWQ